MKYFSITHHIRGLRVKPKSQISFLHNLLKLSESILSGVTDAECFTDSHNHNTKKF